MDMSSFIQSGGFGNTAPIPEYNPYVNNITPQFNQQFPYLSSIINNPMPQQPMMMYSPQPMYSYEGNIIPVGSYNYNSTGLYQPMYQPQPVQPDPVNGMIFAPVVPQPINSYPMQRRDDYYNPFPQFQQPYQGYRPFSPYMGGNPYMSVQRLAGYKQMRIGLEKQKCKIYCTYMGKEYDDDYYDRIFNPDHPMNQRTPEQYEADREWNYIQSLSKLFMAPPTSMILTPELSTAMYINNSRKNFHDMFDNHSMCEFFEEDFPRLMHEEWLRTNIRKNANRDLSGTYDSKGYNELLAMHKESAPYISELLDNSRYDNNLTELELGLRDILDRAKQAANRLTRPVPKYISSPEVQEQRRKFSEMLISQMYEKEAKKSLESS